jgi:DNA-binding transcriptional LysR family regulator
MLRPALQSAQTISVIFDIRLVDIRKADLNLLVVLDALLRLRNVSRAAEALDMSQPAVSFALRKLRALFADPLFIRAARGLRPTPRAEGLALPLQEVLDRVRTGVLTPPRFDPAATQRTFTFNMADVGELVFLPATRSRLASVAPGANIRTVSTPPAELEEAMRSGAVDLAVGYFPGLRGAAIYQQRLFSHSFVCIVSRNHPRIRGQITKKQFLEEKHAVVQQEGKSHELFEQALAEQGLSRRIALSVPHFLAIPLIIAESDLVVTVPYAVARSFGRMTELTLLRPPIQVPQAEVKQHWHARFHHDEANRWIRGVVASLFGETPRRERTR